MICIGIDVHKNKSQICVLFETGEVKEQRINTDRQRFAAVFGPDEMEPAKILIEASTESEWVARCLEDLGHEVVVADPNFKPMYGWRTRGVKTDRADARTLAEALMIGAYRTAHRVSDKQQRIRTKLSVRELMVRQRTKLISLTRATLRRAGYHATTGGSHTFAGRVSEMELSDDLRAIIAPILAVMATLNEQIKCASKELEDLCRNDEQLSRLQTVPNVGPLTSAAFAARIDTTDRFRSARQAECYLGLVPRERSSGDSQRRGHITKAGDSRVRSLLMQAAVGLMRVRNPRAQHLIVWADRIALRRGKRIALVALARKLAGILFAIMRDGTVYTPQKDSKPVAIAA